MRWERGREGRGWGREGGRGGSSGEGRVGREEWRLVRREREVGAGEGGRGTSIASPTRARHSSQGGIYCRELFFYGGRTRKSARAHAHARPTATARGTGSSIVTNCSSEGEPESPPVPVPHAAPHQGWPAPRPAVPGGRDGGSWRWRVVAQFEERLLCVSDGDSFVSSQQNRASGVAARIRKSAWTLRLHNRLFLPTLQIVSARPCGCCFS